MTHPTTSPPTQPTKPDTITTVARRCRAGWPAPGPSSPPSTHAVTVVLLGARRARRPGRGWLRLVRAVGAGTLEDAADALAAAAWRAEHAPHLLTAADRAHLDARRPLSPVGGGVMWAVTGWAIATWLKITLAARRSASAPPGCGCSPGWFAALRASPPRWLSCGPSASSPANGPDEARSAPGGGPMSHPRHRPRRARRAVGPPRQPPTRPAGPPAARRPESNDVDLIVTVAATPRCGYVLVGATERVYPRTRHAQRAVARVPRYEDDAVAPTARRRQLTLGGTHHVIRRPPRRTRPLRARPARHPGPGRPLDRPAPSCPATTGARSSTNAPPSRRTTASPLRPPTGSSTWPTQRLRTAHLVDRASTANRCPRLRRRCTRHPRTRPAVPRRQRHRRSPATHRRTTASTTAELDTTSCSTTGRDARDARHMTQPHAHTAARTAPVTTTPSSTRRHPRAPPGSTTSDHRPAPRRRTTAHWRAQVEATGGCAAPIHLPGSSQILDRDGAVLLERAGTVLAPCGNRRASGLPGLLGPLRRRRLPPAARRTRRRRHQERARHASTEHPRAFLTLTAPSFGPVHTRTVTRRGHVIPCRCGERHHPDDPRLGTALDPDSYDYDGAVLWQAHAGALWARFTIALRRALAAALGVRAREFRDHARLSYAKVAEYQRRGLVHFHAVIRLDGPDGPADPPPAGLDLDRAAGRHHHRRPRRARSPRTAPTGHRCVLGWGAAARPAPGHPDRPRADRGRRRARSPTPPWPATSPSTPPKAPAPPRGRRPADPRRRPRRAPATSATTTAA